MGDANLRRLERCFRETGSAEDEAAWLRARRQAGRLEDWRAKVAGHCRPELLLASSPPSSCADWLATFPFAGRRGRLRREWVRLPLAAAHALLPVAEQLGQAAPLSEALATAEHALVSGGRGSEALAAALERIRQFRYELQPDDYDERPPAVAIAHFVAAALRFLLDPAAARPADLGDWARAALEPEGVWAVEPGLEDAIEACFPRAGGRLWGLRQAIGAELAAWALGYGDPIRMRVEARPGEIGNGKPEVIP